MMNPDTWVSNLALLVQGDKDKLVKELEDVKEKIALP